MRDAPPLSLSRKPLNNYQIMKVRNKVLLFSCFFCFFLGMSSLPSFSSILNINNEKLNTRKLITIDKKKSNDLKERAPITVNQTVHGNELYYGATRLNSNQNSKKWNFNTNSYIKRIAF